MECIIHFHVLFWLPVACTKCGKLLKGQYILCTYFRPQGPNTQKYRYLKWLLKKWWIAGFTALEKTQWNEIESKIPQLTFLLELHAQAASMLH